MGKEDLRLIDNIHYFSRLLDRNFKNLLETKELLMNKIPKEERKSVIKKSDDELLILSEIWKKIYHIKYKRKTNKPRKNAKELKKEKEKKKSYNNHSLKERNFMLVKKYLKNVCSEQKKQNLVYIQLKELCFTLKKYLDDKITILFPQIEKILQNVKKENSISKDSTIYAKISNQIPFVISLIHLITGTVMNLNFNIQKTDNILQQYKSFTLKVKLNNFNFHYLYESKRNITPMILNKNYKLKHLNSVSNLELLEKRIKEISSISLNLKSSEFDYYNQLTLGMRKRIEDYNYMTVDPKSFFTKYLVFCNRYLKLGLKSKNIFCSKCKNFLKIDADTGKCEYPVINLQKDFYHFSCSKNTEN